MKTKNKMVLALINKVKPVVLRLFYFSMLITYLGYGQDNNKEKENPVIKEAREFVAEGNDQLNEQKFSIAETSYRKAIAKDPSSLPAKYNLGNNYYRNNKFAEGTSRYIQAAKIAKTKSEKHRAFHNLGNAYYQQKNYKKAVEAYKNALRNDPTDEETRYNLALAKKEEEKQGGEGENENKDQDQNQDQENKDKEGEGEEKEDENGKPKENNEDKGDEKKEDGDKKEDENGKPDEKDGENKDPKDDQQEPQQPVQGQLSPQQVKSLLEAMKNEENKVQEKINARKVKGAKVKSEKDW